MVDSVCDWNAYEAPSNQILRNRQAFYSLQRKAQESVDEWLKRIQSTIRCCEFPTIIEFLLIDRFVCGLNRNELVTIRCGQSWTVERLEETFTSENIKNDPSESNAVGSEYIVPNQMIAVDFIKLEPVCCCFQFYFTASIGQ